MKQSCRVAQDEVRFEEEADSNFDTAHDLSIELAEQFVEEAI